jgi:capsular exopolysaccharide synthesis family protein
MSRRALVDPDSPYAEPFRTLRLAVEARLGTSDARGLVFTSAAAGDGKSTIAANYAVVTAFVQRPVLLIDADMRRPRVHEIFDLPRSPGLVEVLRDRLDVAEVVHTFPSLGGLNVLTAGAPLTRPGDVAASAPMRALLEQVYDQYEAVVIDTPPVHAAADATSISSNTGTALAMVAKRTGRRRPLLSALRKIALADVNLLGIVLNQDGTVAYDLT